MIIIQGHASTLLKHIVFRTEPDEPLYADDRNYKVERWSKDDEPHRAYIQSLNAAQHPRVGLDDQHRAMAQKTRRNCLGTDGRYLRACLLD
jgi:hypothetical protein